MARIHREQNRRGGSKPRRQRARRRDEAGTGQFHEHPLYGAIPIITVQHLDQKGEPHEYRDYDPDYQPKMPPGAVRGDVRRQEFCRMCHVPRYFYVDQEKTCVQCGQAFAFTAAEQKHWYEVLKFHFDSVAIRCPNCRRKQRTIRALRQQLALAKVAWREASDDPVAMLELAEAIVRCHQRTGQGDLDEAISMARRAVRRQSFPEALFWEGMCHAMAGRDQRAKELLASFIGRAGRGRRQAEFVAEARAWLAGNATR